MSVIVLVLVLLAMSFVVPGRNEWRLFRRFNVVAHGGGHAVLLYSSVCRIDSAKSDCKDIRSSLATTRRDKRLLNLHLLGWEGRDQDGRVGNLVPFRTLLASLS